MNRYDNLIGTFNLKYTTKCYTELCQGTKCEICNVVIVMSFSAFKLII